jgi:hypothetical protein
MKLFYGKLLILSLLKLINKYLTLLKYLVT